MGSAIIILTVTVNKARRKRELNDLPKVTKLEVAVPGLEPGQSRSRAVLCTTRVATSLRLEAHLWSPLRKITFKMVLRDSELQDGPQFSLHPELLSTSLVTAGGARQFGIKKREFWLHC